MAGKNAKLGKVLYTQEDITRRAKEICKQIDKDYEGEEVLLLGTLKGSIMWMVDIMKYLTVDTSIDFITASSYGSSSFSSGVVKITYEPNVNMYNKNVIIIEDIVDTGNTLKYLIEKLEGRGPKSIKVCSMLNKEARRKTDFKADYVGFEIDDLFVVGYGLDFDQKYRDLPYISYLDAEDVEKL
ncbi:MAG: hypoxanthine phosphoribosyltransferase [Mogibacterium sp.]|nr:hypoxanthine phosphoribosyltransferase [Mogibacterium sp.]